MNINDMHKLKALVLLSAALLIWGVSRTPPVGRFISAVQAGMQMNVLSAQAGDGDAAVAVWGRVSSDRDDALLQQIRAESERTRIPPVDAKLDTIWKAVPGLNGREIDVDKSYRLALQLPAGSPLHYVYRDVKPTVGLDELGAQPIYKGNPGKRMISLMINVAWGDEYLPSMLETLKKENVHATFFFDGTWLSSHLDTAKSIGAQGHELSNHAYSHKNMSQLSRSRAEQEIHKTEKLLQSIGVNNKLFAPPSGDFDQETVEIAHAMKLRTVLWTIDTVDWKKPRPEVIIAKIASKLEPGAMILMHPTSSSMQALEGIIRTAKTKGYALGTVSELISPDRLPELETNLGK
jgi:probable sporulation protein (polysaccharide deacetylase family)